MEKKQGVSSLKVAATYIGTVVGAGFATGQEVLQFFSRFGIMGIPGILLTTFLFIVFGMIIMELGKQLSARSHLEIIQYSSGRILGAIIDFLITFFLFGSISAMIAGTGALFAQQFHLPALSGCILMAVITAATVLTGRNGVINSISFVVPFLLVAVIGTSIFSIATSPPDITAAASDTAGGGLMSNWILAAVLYVSYNTVISVAILGPLGDSAKGRSALKTGAVLGGLGLGISLLMIFLAISGNRQGIVGLEVPMVYIAGEISYLVQMGYAVVLIAEIYTTAVGSLYGFVCRLTEAKNSQTQIRWVVIITSIAALAASQLGFSNLVKYLYPLVGYGGIVLLICLIYNKIHQVKSK